MSGDKAAHYDMIKEQNRRIIRNLLREESPQSIAKLAKKASLSYPTVASLLKELELHKEVMLCEEVESCGGRPGILYELNATYQYGLLLTLTELEFIGHIIDAFGRFVKEVHRKVSSEVSVTDVLKMLTNIKMEYPKLSVISMGIPGVVYQNEIISLPTFPHLVGGSLYQMITSGLQTTLFIHNDLNTISFGEIVKDNSFAHIAYVNHCIGTGVVIDGKVLEGSQGFAGEMEFVCPDMNQVEESLYTCILSFVCVLAVPKIYLSGEECTKQVLENLKNRLKKILPVDRIPELTLAKDLQQKYEEGLLRYVLLEWESNS